MSGEFEIIGELIGGILATAAVVAVAPVALVGYGIYRGGKALYAYNQDKKRKQEEEKRVQEELKRKQNESYYNQMQSIYQSYQQISKEHEEHIRQLDIQMQTAMSQAYDGFQAELNHAGNMKSLEERADKTYCEITQKWSKQREQMTKNYESKLHYVFQSMSNQFAETKTELINLQNAAKDDPRIEAMAREAIERAKAILSLYQSEANTSNVRYISELDEAVRYYNSQDFGIAHSKASALALTCFSELENIKQQQNIWFELTDEITKKIYIIEERIANTRNVQFNFKGQIIQENLTRFEPAMINGLSDYVEKLKNRLSEFKVFSKEAIPQLRILLADCNEADAVQIAKYLFSYKKYGIIRI